MMRNGYPLVVCSIVCTWGTLLPGNASAQGGAAASPALAALKADKPGVNWDAKSLTRADVSCDGQPDTLMLGREKGRVWLGVVAGRSKQDQAAQPGQTGAVTTFPFPYVSSSTPGQAAAQDGFCHLPVRIEVGPLICDTDDGPLPGCKPSKTCKAFALFDDTCDAISFYWDSEQNKLVFWRH